MKEESWMDWWIALKREPGSRMVMIMEKSGGGEKKKEERKSGVALPYPRLHAGQQLRDSEQTTELWTFVRF